MNLQSSEVSPALVRIALGIVFAISGIGKLAGIGPKAAGIEGFTGFLVSLGIPAPSVFAIIVGVVELAGGLLLLAGLFTRYAALLIAIDMAAATLLVHLPNGFAASNGGYEYTLVLLLAALSLVFSGAGNYSLETTLFDEEQTLPFDPLPISK